MTQNYSLHHKLLLPSNKAISTKLQALRKLAIESNVTIPDLDTLFDSTESFGRSKSLIWKEYSTCFHVHGTQDELLKFEDSLVKTYLEDICIEATNPLMHTRDFSKVLAKPKPPKPEKLTGIDF